MVGEPVVPWLVSLSNYSKPRRGEISLAKRTSLAKEPQRGDMLHPSKKLCMF
jgi:hypothetical protein